MRKIAALILMAVGFMAFLYGIGRGMAINPRIDLHGRMVAYAIGMAGLTVAFGCHAALTSKDDPYSVSRPISVSVALLAFALFIYQLTRIL